MLSWSSLPVRWRCAWQLGFDAVSCLSEKWTVKLFWTSMELITYVLSGISELSLKHKGKHHEPGQSPVAVKLWSCSFCQTVKPEQGQDSTNRRPASLQEHTTSQCLLLAEKHFVLSLNRSIALLLPHISLFHTITNSTRRERKKKPLPVANGKHFFHGIYSKTSQLQKS